MSPDSLQELAIRKIMDARRCFLNSEERHLVNALHILGYDTEGLSLAELPRVLRDEILRREHIERFDNVLSELSTAILNTNELLKLIYSDVCIRPSVISSYCKEQAAKERWYLEHSDDDDDDDDEEPHPWDLNYNPAQSLADLLNLSN